MVGEEQQQPFRNIQSINSAPILMWLHIVIRYPILGAEERQWRIAELSDPHPSIIYIYLAVFLLVASLLLPRTSHLTRLQAVCAPVHPKQSPPHPVLIASIYSAGVVH